VTYIAFGVGGDHDHRHILPLRQGKEAAHEFQPVHLRHHVVQQDQVRLLFGAPGQCQLRVGKRVHRHAFQPLQDMA
jgi:hypothetical protein